MADQEHRQPEDTEEAPAQAETPESEAPAGEAAASGELQKRVESLEAALGSAKEQVLRAQADAQNAQRRAQQDVEKAHKYGQEKLVADLLPVVDNLERALAAIDTTDESMKPVIEGIELTHKSFIDSLKSHQVEPIDPQGEPFDPQLHQAMTMVANPEVEPNTVVEVFQKGYTLHGRLVRPAMVVVSKAE